MEQNPSWKNSFKEAFKDTFELYRFLGWDGDILLPVEKKYPVFIPRRLADKIKEQGPSGVLAKEFLPNLDELNNELNQSGLEDPIGDQVFQKAPQLIHRYTSRALFTPTNICPVHCRYCFRKNELNTENDIFAVDFNKTLSYLREHTEISEIIFTGGDPLTLSNERLSGLLEAFSNISSIKDIRFHTRYPVIMPERIDQELLNTLRNYSQHFRTISLAIHANHIDEFDDLSIKAIGELSKLNIQLLSQTVLLKGINDSVDSLIELINFFVQLKVRPYYLHHPDRVKGGMHFYLSLEAGRKLYGQIRSLLPGWAIPNYVIDIPGGSGKVNAYNPETTAFGGTLLGIDGLEKDIEELHFLKNLEAATSQKQTI